MTLNFLHNQFSILFYTNIRNDYFPEEKIFGLSLLKIDTKL
jgi:hypothetical protein